MRLLIVHHTPSPALQAMFEAVVAGATTPEIEGVEVVRRAALSTTAVDVLEADGYLLGTADNALVVNPGLFRDRLPYDTERDLGTLGLAVTAPLLLLAHPAAPARSLGEVLDAMRAHASNNPEAAALVFARSELGLPPNDFRF